MSIEELKANLKRETEELNRVNARVNELKLALAIAQCPYKIGDIVVNKKGKRARITEITTGYQTYQLIGATIRKDGSDGAVGMLAWWQEWKSAP
jgi:hypothetical protein